MATAKATLSNFRQTPRKMRVVANLVRGKKVSDALISLDFIAKKAALPIKTLIESAVANAKNLDIKTEDLIVKKISVDAGKIMYRRLPASRGSAHKMRKRTSIVSIELSSKNEDVVVKSKKEEIKEVPEVKEKKVIKKTVAKKKVSKKTDKSK